jgi:tetratricopeptide (TPR) repeat protein
MGKRRTFWNYNEMGVYFYNRGAYDLAIAELRRAVGAALIPMAVPYVNLGAAYLAKKMYHEAEACLRKALTIKPDNQKGHGLLGRVLLATGATSEALKEFERAWELDPDSPEGRSAHEHLLTFDPARRGSVVDTEKPR